MTTPIFKALDLCAVHGPREHELLAANGRYELFRFEPRKYLELPMSIAMQLVGNDGFEVLDQDGQPLTLRPAVTGNKPGIVLRPDEIVARINELHIDALVERANGKRGGESMSKRDGREKLIAFLMANDATETVVAVDDGEPVAA